jgi:hypothetical protein
MNNKTLGTLLENLDFLSEIVIPDDNVPLFTRKTKNIAVKSQKDTHETVIATKVFDVFENNHRKNLFSLIRI